jgi:transposase
MRRTWLRGLEDVIKRYRIAAAAHNLGRILRKLFGVGKPRALQGENGLCSLAQLVITLLNVLLAGCRTRLPTPRFAHAA